MAAAAPAPRDVPLLEWLREHDGDAATGRAALLRKAAVAYGVAALLRHLVVAGAAPDVASSDRRDVAAWCAADNLAVILRAGEEGPGGRTAVVAGVALREPPVALRLVEPPFLRDLAGDDGGKYFEAEVAAGPRAVPSRAASASAAAQDEGAVLRALGRVLYALFSHLAVEATPLPGRPLPEGAGEGDAAGDDATRGGEPARKKPRRGSSGALPLRDFGLPASISVLVQSLLAHPSEASEAGDGTAVTRPYRDLETVAQDLHLLLLDPPRFLFDRRASAEAAALDFREGTLYGRDKEVAAIQEAFCRVSGNGRSEALFIGGHSGKRYCVRRGTMLLANAWQRASVLRFVSDGGAASGRRAAAAIRLQPCGIGRPEEACRQRGSVCHEVPPFLQAAVAKG